MDCAACAQTIQKGVSKFPGVSNVEVDFIGGTLKFEGSVEQEALRQRVTALGYRVADDHTSAMPTAAPTENDMIAFIRFLLSEADTRFAVVGGTTILLGALVSLVSDDAANLLYVVATLIALYPVARSGINNLRINHDFSINMLMTIVAMGALLIGETLEAATVVFLFAVGEALEVRVTRPTVNTINRIIRLVEEAQSVRAPSQRHVDRFARVYTPAVVVVALVVALVPPRRSALRWAALR